MDVRVVYKTRDVSSFFLFCWSFFETFERESFLDPKKGGKKFSSSKFSSLSLSLSSIFLVFSNTKKGGGERELRDESSKRKKALVARDRRSLFLFR